jgi:tripartite-type tricarboxylate transporter receptor subunit TctC
MRQKTGKNIFHAAVLGVALAFAHGGAVAQDSFPSKPVRLVVPYPAGGPTDIMGRLVGQKLTDAWKQSVIVENRAGASGSIGSDFVAKSAPDGYTLVLGNNASHGAYEVLTPTAPYRTLRDFAPVSLIGIQPLIMIVRSSLDIKNAKEYVAYAKANPGKMNYGSAAIGSAPHFGAELLNTVAGINVVHIPFNGTAPAIQALLSGSIDSYMGGVSSVIGVVRDGRARLVGVVGAQRTEQLPDLQTLGEQGFPGIEYDSWYGVLAPAAVPAPILDKINADTNRGLDGAEVRAQLLKLGFERKLGARTDFVQLLRKEEEKTVRLVREAGIKAQ